MNRFELPLYITVRPSLWVAIGIYASHAGAVLVLILSGLPWTVNALITAGVLTSLIQTRSRYLSLTHPASVLEIILNHAGEWWLTTAGGQTVQVMLAPGAFVHPSLVVLAFKADQQGYRVILTPDVTDSDSFRRLRVRLKFKVQGSELNV